MTACLVLAAAEAVTARSSRAQDDLLGEIKTIGEVRFEGRDQVGEGELLSVMKTRGPSIWPWREKPALRPDFLRTDTLAIRIRYLHHGFLDTRVGVLVTPRKDSSQVTVTFLIHEGERSRVARVDLDSVRSYPEDELRSKLRMRPGQPFDPAALQLDTLKISELYQERGFRPHVVATAWRGDGADSLRVRVLYEVFEGPQYKVGETYVSGYDKVDERLVRRELLLTPGDTYKRSRMVRSGERLYDTGLFSQVQISPIVDSTNSRMDFDFRVRERKPRWIDAGIGSGTSDRFRATGEWGHRNVFGRGFLGVLATQIGFDKDWQFQLSHTQVTLLEPWLLRTRTRASITPFYERSHERADPRNLLRQDTRGLKFVFGRDISRLSSVTITQNNTWVHEENIPTDRALPPIISDYRTHSIALGGVRDVRDNPFIATRGSMQGITAEWTGGVIKGSSSFRKVDIVSAWYTPFRRDWVLATRVRGGFIDPRGDDDEIPPDRLAEAVPSNDRFRTGGVNSVRGYNENTIAPRRGTIEQPESGGLVLLQANVELRVPLIGPFGVEVYLDAGNVWLRHEYMSWGDFVPRWSLEPLGENEVRYVIGIGPRVNLPIGPLRLDVTWGFRPIPNNPGHISTSRTAKYQFAIGPSY